MTCAEFKEQAAAFALGVLEPDEMAACEAHLAGAAHSGCLEELDRAHEAVAAIGASLPPLRPPPRIWAAIERDLGASTVVEVPRRSRAAIALPWVAAAAAAVIAGFFYFSQENLYERAEKLEARASEARRALAQVTAATAEQDETTKVCQAALKAARDDLRLRDEAVALLQLPATKVVSLTPQGTKTSHGTVVVNLLERRAVVMASGLVPATDKDYELWVIRGNDKLAAGLLHGEQAVAVIDPALLASADAFAITLEPAGGGPTPRGELIMVGMVPKT